MAMRARSKSPPVVSIDEIKLQTLRILPELCRQLAPHGNVAGGEYVAKNPARADRKAGSFSINLTSGVWSDFATGDGGDVISLVAYLACAGDNAKAVIWLKDRLGLTDRAPDPVRAAKAKEALAKHDDERAAGEEQKRAGAWRLVKDMLPLDGNCPASLYLAARGIDVMALAEGPPRSLGFHPHVYASDGSGPYPALVAIVSREGLPNGFAGIHRIYLREDGGRWVKARDGSAAKEAKGMIKGACVRLQNGASRQRMKDAPAGEWVHWTEGIEDALCVALALPHARVVAGPTLGNLPSLQLPDQLAGVVVCRDNDPPGSAADAAVMKHCFKLKQRGVRAKIARPPAGFKDWNDVLIGKRAV